MARSIDVAVSNGLSFSRLARNRPARILPTGYVGAVVGGIVRPVYRHRLDCLSVDLMDAGFEPSVCPYWGENDSFLFVDDTRADHNAAIVDYYIETNSYGHYVVFNGDESVLDDVASRLTRSIGVRRFSTSHRPADNGVQYDWFVRLDFDGSREQAEDLVKFALSHTDDEDGATDLAGHGEISELIASLPKPLQLRAAEEGLHQRGAPELVSWLGFVAETSLNDIDSVKLSLQEEIDRVTETALARQAHFSQRESSDANEISLLKLQVGELRQALLVQINDQTPAPDLQQQNAALESLQKENNELWREWQENETKLRSQTIELEEAKQQILQLMKENQRLEHSNRLPRRISERLLQSLHVMLNTLSNMDIHGDAAETIADRFENPVPVLNALVQLNGGDNAPSKRITTAEGWRELDRHINTGRCDRGRIYFKKQQNSRLLAVVHFKQDDTEQQRFFSKLNNPAFLQNNSFDLHT